MDKVVLCECGFNAARHRCAMDRKDCPRRKYHDGVFTVKPEEAEVSRLASELKAKDAEIEQFRLEQEKYVATFDAMTLEAARRVSELSALGQRAESLERENRELKASIEAIDEYIQKLHDECTDDPDHDERIIGACHARAALFRCEDAAREALGTEARENHETD